VAESEPFPDLHAVTYDVNIYLDVAELLGPPFSWDKVRAFMAKNSGLTLPHHPDRRVDSVHAIAVAMSGMFVRPEPLEVWSSNHIADLVELKASQPRDGATAELRGLGWTATDARDLLIDFHDDLIFEMSGGGLVDLVGIDGRPPLSHEDACVFTTAAEAAADTIPPPHRYCVTRDERFRNATLPDRALVLFPHEFVAMVHKSRRAMSIRALRQAP
jgi:hypothetical protein